MRELAPQFHIPWSIPTEAEDIPIVPTTSGTMWVPAVFSKGCQWWLHEGQSVNNPVQGPDTSSSMASSSCCAACNPEMSVERLSYAHGSRDRLEISCRFDEWMTGNWRNYRNCSHGFQRVQILCQDRKQIRTDAVAGCCMEKVLVELPVKWVETLSWNIHITHMLGSPSFDTFGLASFLPQKVKRPKAKVSLILSVLCTLVWNQTTW